MKDYKLIPDARNLMESTRSIGYSLPAAVADLVDNSIAARATTVELSTPVPPSHEYFVIFDDGFGMDSQELLDAMRYGSKFVGEARRSEDLGRFGLGLKVASLSQCRCLTVVSKKRGCRPVGACWDLDHIANADCPWALQILNLRDISQLPWFERLNAQESGTLVVWGKLDILLQGIKRKGQSAQLHAKVVELKKHLSLVFHRYLDGDVPHPIKIIFNGDELKAADPFLRNKSQRPFAVDVYRLAGSQVEIEPFVLPHPKFLSASEKQMAGDLQKDQGFYVYRNKRLVIWGTWFGLSRKQNLSKLARVRVDIPASAELDRLWALDVKKSSAFIPEELKGELKRVVENLGNRSGQVWTRRARVEQSGDALWLRKKTADNVICYSINENNSLVQELMKRLPELKHLLRLISSRMPLDSIYADLGNDQTIDSLDEAERQAIEELKKLGFDTSFLERQLRR